MASGNFVITAYDSRANNESNCFKMPPGQRPTEAGICTKRLVICSRLNFSASDLHNNATGWLFASFHFLLDRIGQALL
jgi:hypothetical protein